MPTRDEIIAQRAECQRVKGFLQDRAARTNTLRSQATYWEACAMIDAYIAALEATASGDAALASPPPDETGWARWLGPDETPLQRMEREFRDCQAVTALLAEARAEIARLNAAQAPPPDPPGLGADDANLTWRGAALRVGEELASVGPSGYYAMTQVEWRDWALDTLAARQSDPPGLDETTRRVLLDWMKQSKPSGHSGDEESGVCDADCERCAWEAAAAALEGAARQSAPLGLVALVAKWKAALAELSEVTKHYNYLVNVAHERVPLDVENRETAAVWAEVEARKALLAYGLAALPATDPQEAR